MPYESSRNLCCFPFVYVVFCTSRCFLAFNNLAEKDIVCRKYAFILFFEGVFSQSLPEGVYFDTWNFVECEQIVACEKSLPGKEGM